MAGDLKGSVVPSPPLIVLQLDAKEAVVLGEALEFLRAGLKAQVSLICNSFKTRDESTAAEHSINRNLNTVERLLESLKEEVLKVHG